MASAPVRGVVKCVSKPLSLSAIVRSGTTRRGNEMAAPAWLQLHQHVSKQQRFFGAVTHVF